ncbi:MAG TPA: response regulator transcription factor [Terriglobales bacterium]|jgi:DNA-binding response OmpR family regulator|nr:response regulator transcription factor [Terriglobales bacterium]
MRLLVAEADASLAQFLQNVLEQDHFVVQLISSGNAFAHLPEDSLFDLILFDLSLPGVSGLEFVATLQQRWRDVPLILLSAPATVEERVAGLNAGADDIILKPFSVSELIARVHAVLRRRTRPARDVFVLEDLEIDRVSHRVSRGGRIIDLSPKEYALLEFLVRHPGRPVTRSAIIEQVWRMHSESITNVVDVYINYLRRKIDTGADRPLIRTIRGVGYQIGSDHSAQ